jgi:asparagine N-glycosylation enzyme membrane subunit Stt3
MTKPIPSELLRARPTLLAPALALLAVWAILQALCFQLGNASLAFGLLADTDSYMRLLRVESLLATGRWHDSMIAGSNAPFGETMHWTRLFDLVLIASSLPTMPFLGVRPALYWSGASVSPAMHLALGFAVLWATRPFFDRPGRPGAVLAAALVLAQAGVLNYSLAGNADHHTFLMVLFALVLGAFLRFCAAPAEARPQRLPIVAGALSALAVWGSVEITPAIVAGAAAGGLLWIRFGEDLARQNLRFAAAYAGFVALALAIERAPAQLLVAEYDRISIAQLTAAGAVLATWLLVHLAAAVLGPPKTARRRFAVAAGAAALAGLGLFLLFPKLLAGPGAAFDPAIRPIWLDHVREMQPLWPTTGERAATLFFHLLIAMIAALVIATGVARSTREAHWRLWLCLAAAMALAAPVALYYMRFSPYAEIVAGIALAPALQHVVDWSRRIGPLALRAAFQALAFFACFMAPLSAGAAFKRGAAAEPISPAARAAGTCDIRALAEHFNRAESPLAAAPRTIATFVFLGPELIFRTPHRVIGTPYHRNVAGLVDNHAVFAGDVERARRVIEARKVDYVLICPSDHEARIYARAGSDRLYNRLIAEAAPAWLAPVALPPRLAATFRLYAVKRP